MAQAAHAVSAARAVHSGGSPLGSTTDLDTLRNHMNEWRRTGAFFDPGCAPQIAGIVNSFFSGVSPQFFRLRVPQLPLPQKILCHRVFSEPGCTVMIFVVPKGMSLPFHDHPSMNVVGKLLYGKLQIISTESPVQNGMNEAVRVRGVVDTLDASAMFEVEPDKNNIHAVTALEDAAFIDFIFPAYGDEGREITFFAAESMQMCSATEMDLILRRVRSVDYVTFDAPYFGPTFKSCSAL